MGRSIAVLSSVCNCVGMLCSACREGLHIALLHFGGVERAWIEMMQHLRIALLEAQANLELPSDPSVSEMKERWRIMRRQADHRTSLVGPHMCPSLGTYIYFRNCRHVTTRRQLQASTHSSSYVHHASVTFIPIPSNNCVGNGIPGQILPRQTA
jgi:hypothetical protein